MAPIPDGVYTIVSGHGHKELATARDHKPGDHVVVLPPTGHTGEQEWTVKARSNGNVTIRNKQSKLYLSYEGKPEINKQIETLHEKREWHIQQSAEKHKFHVVVPGGPVDGHELAFDFSLLKIVPQRTALRPLQLHDQDQAWNFEPRK